MAEGPPLADWAAERFQPPSEEEEDEEVGVRIGGWLDEEEGGVIAWLGEDRDDPVSWREWLDMIWLSLLPSLSFAVAVDELGGMRG